MSLSNFKLLRSTDERLLTGATALVFKYEVELQKDNKQTEVTVVHVSYVGMQTTWTLPRNVPIQFARIIDNYPFLMTQPEGSLNL
jgi:hypothetical protein